METKMTEQFSASTPLSKTKKAILVGASRGLGSALAIQLAEQGYSLALLGRSKEDLDKVCEEINKKNDGIRARAYQHDVRNYDHAKELFPVLVKDLGGLDLLVFNSGVLVEVGIDEFNFAADKEMIEVNLLGAMAWMDLAAEMFLPVGRGQIVGISSVAGDRGRVLNPGYGASKAGLSSYLESYRNRLVKKGIGVLTVKPGFMDTDMTKGRSGLFFMSSPEDAAKRIIKAINAGKSTIYVSPIWGLIMHIIRHIPSFIFRKLSF